MIDKILENAQVGVLCRLSVRLCFPVHKLFWKQPEIPSHLRFGSKQLSFWYIKAFKHTNSPTRSKPWLFPEGGVEDNSAWMTEHEDKARTTWNSRESRAEHPNDSECRGWTGWGAEKGKVSRVLKGPSTARHSRTGVTGCTRTEPLAGAGAIRAARETIPYSSEYVFPSAWQMCIHAALLNSLVFPRESQSRARLLGEGCTLSQLCSWQALCNLGKAKECPWESP